MTEALVELTSEDLNYSQAPACEALRSDSSGEWRCQRPREHLGDHAALLRSEISHKLIYCVWNRSMSSLLPSLPKWLERECGECGIPLVGKHREEDYCFTCRCWLRTAEAVMKGEKYIFHKGICYRVVGFKHRTHRAKLKKADGGEEVVCLRVEGRVPRHLTYLMLSTPPLVKGSLRSTNV